MNQISVWHSKFNILPYSKVQLIKFENLFKPNTSYREFEPSLHYGNFIFTNEKEIAITNFQYLSFYNLESKKIVQIEGKNYREESTAFCPNNMILISKNRLLMGYIDDKFGLGSVLLIDTKKKEIIAQKILQLYSIIKLKNGYFICGALEENNKGFKRKIMRLKILDDKLVIMDSQICHKNKINDIIELDNGIIISGSVDGFLKVWKQIR